MNSRKFSVLNVSFKNHEMDRRESKEYILLKSWDKRGTKPLVTIQVLIVCLFLREKRKLQ